MKHYTEQELDKYVLSPKEYSGDEISAIQDHLDECSLCYEHVQKLWAFYTEIAEGLNVPPSERDKAFAEQLTTPLKPRLALPSTAIEKRDDRIDAYVEIMEPQKRPLPARIYYYYKFHPIQSFVRTSLAAALVWFSVYYFTPKNIHQPVVDTNPGYARAEKEFLVTYNKDGKELWRKHVGIGYDWGQMRKDEYTGEHDNYLRSIDIDRDGVKECITIFGRNTRLPELDNLILCYNSDGSLRWKYEFHRNMIFGNETFSDDYRIDFMLVSDLENDGTFEVYAIAKHNSFYPCDIIRLNANDGTLLNEYWHSGHVTTLLPLDLDNDGIKEIISGGENNGLNVAPLFVLDSRIMSGHAPSTPDYTPKNVETGNEKFYILIPRNDLQKLSIIKRNILANIKQASYGIETIVTEVVAAGSFPLIYQFDSTMYCTKVADTDWFVSFHKKMEANGKLTKKLDAQYWEDLRQKVQYWDGEKFVNEPAMNKRYINLKPSL